MWNLRRHRESKNGRRGGAIVEFAFAAPLVIILMFATVQYGIYLNTRMTLANLCHQAAGYAAQHPKNDSDTLTYINTVLPPSIRWSEIQNNITISPAQGNTARVYGNPITVSITFNMNNRRFLPSIFFGVPIFSGTITQSGSSVIQSMAY